MGQEQKCTMRIGKKVCQAKVQLEAGHLLVHADEKLKLPYQSISEVSAKNGWLRICCKDTSSQFELELGNSAEKWAQKILNPPSRLDKLGIKAGMKIKIQSVSDDTFASELNARNISAYKPKDSGVDLFFLQANNISELSALQAAKDTIQQNGAVWIIYPKGIKEITQSDVFAAIKDAGMTDIKVVSFSESHTALKAVIPVAKRERSKA